MNTINRTGIVNFHDAELKVWEEDIPREYDAREIWERVFKRQVFLRIIQQLNRLGWTCVVPDEMVKQYSRSFAESHRYCRKGELQADLSVTGRCIEFKMFQNINAPDRPDHGGHYQYDKELHMPYLMRLEMERTRHRIRNYLCGVFEGYEFKNDDHNVKIGPGTGQVTALKAAAIRRRTSGHYVPELDRARICNPGYDQSADSQQLENGMRVYAQDRSGRIISGTAFYSLNGNWQIVSGRYGLIYAWHNQIWVNTPGDLRTKRNGDIRRKRLEGELSNAIKAMDFERAAIVRDILFPKHIPLFVVRHKEHAAYHRPNFCGYTNDMSEAGKFMASELIGCSSDLNEIIPLGVAA